MKILEDGNKPLGGKKMLAEQNTDDYEVISEHEICDFHKKNPNKGYAGCTCVHSWTKGPHIPRQTEPDTGGL